MIAQKQPIPLPAVFAQQLVSQISKRKEVGSLSVELRAGESQESLLKRFRKEIVKTRILSTYRKKRWYVSKSEQRRLAKQRAIRKARRKMMRRHYPQ
jgi:small subunit ribosomal protein S21